MPLHANIPSRIRVAEPSLLNQRDWLTEGFDQAVRRAVSQAQQMVREHADEDAARRTHAPSVEWSGAGVESVSEALQSTVEQEIRAILDRIIADNGLPAAGSSTGPATARRAGQRDWIVIKAISVRMPVEGYLEYFESVDPREPQRPYFLDILDQIRWLTVWWVKLKVAYHAYEVIPEIIQRMEALNPPPADRFISWIATPSERDRANLVRIDRTHRVENNIPSFAQNNDGRVIGSREEAFYLPGTWLLLTTMFLPSLPEVRFAPGQEEAFWRAARRSVFGDNDQARSDMIELLINLRRLPQASAILRDALDVGMEGGIESLSVLHTRHAVLRALRDVADRPYSIALLLLHGVGHPVEHTPQAIFLDWFKQRRGTECLAFLERVLTEGEPSQQTKAAKVLLHLREFAQSEEARSYPANISALEDLVRRHDIFTGGALGEESLRQLIVANIEVLLDQIREFNQSLEHSLSRDPYETDDRQLLNNFSSVLEARKDLLAELDLRALERLHTRVAELIDAGIYIHDRIDGIHTGIRQIRDFLGSIIADSDEIQVLFELRHDYVAAWAAGLDIEDFSASLRAVDNQGAHFSENVAQVKWDRARADYREAINEIHQNQILTRFDGGGSRTSDAFFDIRRQLRSEKDDLRDRFYPRPVQVGGVTVRVMPAVGDRELGVPRDLDDAVNVETRVAIFRMHSAMFGHLSISLMLQNQLVDHEIGSSEFRQQQLSRLERIHEQIVDDYHDSNFERFIEREPGFREAFQDVQRAIRAEVREAIAIELLITAVAAVLSMGAGLVVRAALVGRTVGVLRTARAVESIAFLSEAGVFTATQLAGSRLAFGREITLGRTATATVQNIAFLGGFRILGRLTGPLLERGAWGFVAVHTINATSLSAAAAVLHRFQTGVWPRDIGQFLVQTLGGYFVAAGMAGATRQILLRHTRLGTVIEGRIQQGVDELSSSNSRLLRELQSAAESRTLTREQFGRIKQGLRDNIAQGRELAAQLRDAGLRTPDQYRQMNEALNAMDGMAASMQFVAPPGYLSASGNTVRALPPPAEITGLVRQGNSNLYRYDPNANRSAIDNALARYEGVGYRVERRPGGLIEVSTGGGRLAFMLSPGPAALPEGPTPRGLLTAGDPSRRPMTLLERALGRGELSAEGTQVAEQALATIHPNLLRTVTAEFSDPVAVLAVSVFSRTLPTTWGRWPIDGVRGLATMLQPQRGILLRPIIRLLESRSQAELIELFTKYHAIADHPGANWLVAEDIRPSSSLELIRAYDAIRRARLQLPQDMSLQAIRGLLNWIRQGRNVVTELGRIPVAQRRARLEADSPIRDPRVRPTGSREEQVLRAQNEDIRPDLNLLSGSPADIVVATEQLAQRHGGSFSDPAVKQEFEILVTRYRDRVASFQAGGNVERDMVGYREEINTVLLALELGAEVFSLGNIGRAPTRYHLSIDPGAYPLSRGYRITNAPERVSIQLDVGARAISGRLLIVEATTGDLSLPETWSGLDPESGMAANGTVSWTDLNPSYASHRKWLQVVKLRAAAHFAHELGESWGGTTLQFPELVIRVGRATEPARRALEAMGFEVQESNPRD